MLLTGTLLLSGCSLIPKTVEFGQDKVRKFPERTDSFIEAQRQAAQLTARLAGETRDAALAEGASDAVVRPGSQAAELAGSVSTSLGPPLNPFSGEDPSEMARILDRQVAKHDNRVRNFAAGNDENAGKKIEGTGFLQIPYLIYAPMVILGVVFLFMVGRFILNLYALANPVVGVGLNVASFGAKKTAAALGQVLRGGERFKQRVNTEVEDEKLRATILRMFRDEQEKAQDPEVQNKIKELFSP